MGANQHTGCAINENGTPSTRGTNSSEYRIGKLKKDFTEAAVIEAWGSGDFKNISELERHTLLYLDKTF
jgi:hypothetical protein